MIKCKVNKGSVEASINGDVATLAAEVCCLIRSMYKSIAEDNKECAERFQEIIAREVNGDRIFTENDDDIAEHLERKIPDFDKLKELLEGLEKLKGMLEDED